MSSSSTHLPTPEGPGSVSGAPNLPSGFTDTYRALDTTTAQNEQRKNRRLTLPVLAIGAAEGTGEGSADAMKLAADDVQTLVIDGSGHWVAEEAPEELLAALTEFLAPYREGGGGLR